jgi:hypothetical protein
MRRVHHNVPDRPTFDFEQASGGVVGEAPESEDGTAEEFEAAVHGFGESVAGTWPVEVGQDVAGLHQPQDRSIKDYSHAIFENSEDVTIVRATPDWRA